MNDIGGINIGCTHCGFSGVQDLHKCYPPQPVNVVISTSGSMDKRKGYIMKEGKWVEVNGADVPVTKLNQSTGRPKGARNLHAKHPSSIARAFKRAGLDWQVDFALAIKNNKRERIAMWLRLLPYLITTTNKAKVKKWKGKASKAALIALDALEGKK